MTRCGVYHWENKLFRSEPRLRVRRCNARQLDGHLRLETEDR
jgi:hypothetical protein